MITVQVNFENSLNFKEKKPTGTTLLFLTSTSIKIHVSCN